MSFIIVTKTPNLKEHWKNIEKKKWEDTKGYEKKKIVNSLKKRRRLRVSGKKGRKWTSMISGLHKEQRLPVKTEWRHRRRRWVTTKTFDVTLRAYTPLNPVPGGVIGKEPRTDPNDKNVETPHETFRSVDGRGGL